MKSFSNSLPMSLLRTREAVMRLFRPSLRELGLTEQQWRVMRCIHSEEYVDAKTISNECFILGPSLSRILTDLEKNGIILRQKNENDLRRQIIYLSKTGTRLFDKHAKKSEAIYKSIEKRLGKKKLASLIATLQEVQRALEEGEPRDN